MELLLFAARLHPETIQMPDAVAVTLEIVEGVPVLSLAYEPQVFLTGGFGSTLVSQYSKAVGDASAKSKSLILVIRADTAGSALVQALVRLYQAVARESGHLFCVGYPDEYLPSLSALGVTGLPLFHIAPSREAAIAYLRQRV